MSDSFNDYKCKLTYSLLCMLVHVIEESHRCETKFGHVITGILTKVARKAMLS